MAHIGYGGSLTANNLRSRLGCRQVISCASVPPSTIGAVPHARPKSSLAAVVGGGSGGGKGNGSGGNLGGGGRQGGSEPGPSGEGGWGRAVSLALAGGVLLCGEGAAWAARKPAPPPAPAPKPADELSVDKVAELAWSLAGPILTNLGFSGCVGAAAGFALKKVGQFVAFCVGLGFLFVQGLAYTGFITVNWSHVHRTVDNVLDLNKDGKVDAEDFKYGVAQGLAVLSQGVPSVGGFMAGFMLALRSF